MVAFLLQAFGQIVGLLHSSPSICLPQRLLWALGTGVVVVGLLFLEKSSSGKRGGATRFCSQCLWGSLEDALGQRIWVTSRDISFLYRAQVSLPLQMRLKCTHLHTRSKLTYIHNGETWTQVFAKEEVLIVKTHSPIFSKEIVESS